MLSVGRKTVVETSHIFVEYLKNDKIIAFLLGLRDPSTSLRFACEILQIGEAVPEGNSHG